MADKLCEKCGMKRLFQRSGIREGMVTREAEPVKSPIRPARLFHFGGVCLITLIMFQMPFLKACTRATFMGASPGRILLG